MNFLKLNKVTGYNYDPYHEDPAEDLPAEPEVTQPVTINAEAIKSYYPRRNNRIGTRINFIGGQGFAVKETKGELDEMLQQLGAGVLGEHPTAVVVQLPTQEGTVN